MVRVGQLRLLAVLLPQDAPDRAQELLVRLVRVLAWTATQSETRRDQDAPAQTRTDGRYERLRRHAVSADEEVRGGGRRT